MVCPSTHAVDQFKSFLNPRQSHFLHWISGSIPSGEIQHPPTAYFSKSNTSGSGIPYKICRIDPIAPQPAQIKDLIRLRRLVVMLQNYWAAHTHQASDPNDKTDLMATMQA